MRAHQGSRRDWKHCQPDPGACLTLVKEEGKEESWGRNILDNSTVLGEFSWAHGEGVFEPNYLSEEFFSSRKWTSAESCCAQPLGEASQRGRQRPAH